MAATDLSVSIEPSATRTSEPQSVREFIPPTQEALSVPEDAGDGNQRSLVPYFCRVLSREDRSAVVGARIRLVSTEILFSRTRGKEPVEIQSETVLQETETDPAGLFELGLPSAKNSDIQIQAAGFAGVFLQTGGGHDSPDSAKEVFLSRVAGLRARLLDAHGAAEEDSAVRLWTESFHLGIADDGVDYLPQVSVVDWEENADLSGLCSFQGLPPEVPLHVQVLTAGQCVKSDLPSLILSPGETREVEWRIGTGCLIEGLVLDQDGEAVQNARIWLQRTEYSVPGFFDISHGSRVVLETNTDTDGRFAFRDVSPGMWWVGPAANRGERESPDPEGIAPLAQPVEVWDAPCHQEVLLHVYRGLYISGRVLDPTGKPAGGTFVLGQSTGVDEGLLSTVADPESIFVIGPLVPGRYSLVAKGVTYADSEPTEALAGDENLVLHLRGGGGLSGTVIDAASGDACAAKLTFAPADNPSAFTVTWTDSNGAFRLQGLSPGAYTLMASAREQRLGLLRGVLVQAGRETAGVVVTLERGALLRVKYKSTSGLLNFVVQREKMTVEANCVLPGGTSEIVVPPGHIIIYCEWGTKSDLDSGDMREEKREIEVEVGRERELVFGDNQ